MLDAREVTPLPDRAQSDAAARERAIASLAKALASGEVVGLPTETVYGLGVRADRPEAIQRLVDLKGREAAKALTWHVASAAALEGFDGFGARAQRLAQRYWPGPLTLVLEGVPRGLEALARAGWTGVRCPAHGGTLRVLEACNFPVVLSSANRSGEPPLLDADAVLREFGAGLGALADGGKSRLGEASAVLAIGRGRFEVLRPGLYERAELLATSGRRIALICTGNTCRSPMAEVLARQAIARRTGTADIESIGFVVGSFGVFAAAGSPASANSVRAMAARGLDLSEHLARPAIPEALAHFDELLGLTHAHVEALVALLPPRLASRVAVLDPDGADIPDPVGRDLDEYERCAAAIERAIERRADGWA